MPTSQVVPTLKLVENAPHMPPQPISIKLPATGTVDSGGPKIQRERRPVRNGSITTWR